MFLQPALGSLEGNRGDQRCDLPADFGRADAGSIVIYERPFHVILATAPLTQA